ncbi:hypothetical protein [Microbulbifer elongatus]|uniref:hypothetical protein n=1 Tax=Microbulbifer elongatus TaxID=86173 RepID=UPI001E5A444B|nr:hypothetical protein [Microbulbifer elongatus]
MTHGKLSPPPFKPDISPIIRQKMAELHHTSTHATRFYGSRLSTRLDYPLRQCFQNLKNLHGNLKNILFAQLGDGPGQAQPDHMMQQRRPGSTAVEIALRYRSLALLVPRPGPDLIDYLITTERCQKRLHRCLLEDLTDIPLKISISAQTAMLQITIDRMANFSARLGTADIRNR